MTFFKINDRQVIELSPEPQPGTDRLSHIAIQTDDAERMRAYLGSKGVKVPSQALVGRIGNLAFNVTDPAGHSVEIVQYLPNGKTLLAKGKYTSERAVSNRMLHAGLIVTDLNPESKFYTDILGFKEIWRGSNSGTVLSWINLKVPDGDDYIEFMLSKDAPDPKDWGELHHLCLVVPDVPAAVAKLKAEPYYEKYGREIKVLVGRNRKRQANLYDPDGTRTEIMEATTIDGKPSPSSTAPPPQ
jgi:catechol 2,3-dioxygenase-like lactoylglutathione lyase family enzyme